MKNFLINGFSKLPTGKITNNQTMMCIVEDEEGKYLLVKTSTDYYRVALDEITQEDFDSYFPTNTNETNTNEFHAKFMLNGFGQALLQLPLQNGADGLTIDWGDGSITTGESSHTYSHTGLVTYDVKIKGEIKDWAYSYYGGQATTIIEIINWGNFNITIPGTFTNCENLNLTNTIGTPKITSTGLDGMFRNCKNLTSINNLNDWNTSNVTDMSGMFEGCNNFNQEVSFNTENVTDMSWMFAWCPAFNSNVTLDTKNVTNMNRMFSNMETFNQPLNFNTEKVTDMSFMFYKSEAFNQPLNFNTASVTDMTRMFSDATSFNQNLSNWNIANVTGFSNFDTNATSWVLPRPNFGGGGSSSGGNGSGNGSGNGGGNDSGNIGGNGGGF